MSLAWRFPDMTITPDPHYDPDLIGLDDQELAAALQRICECGHCRADHMGATGALASFGGSACALCWTCGTFRPRDQP